MNPSAKRLLTMLVWALAALLSGAATAEGGPSPAPALDDPAQLETFLDGVIGEHRDLLGPPGVAICVVKEGKVFLSKGYGWADVENRRPVDPRSTIFPVWSVTKAFTAMAVMMLSEQGQLDLGADVRRYAPDLPPAVPGGPVTLHQILTHTTGLDKSLLGLLAGPDGVLPFGPYLAAHPLPRVDPPGSMCQYDLGNTYAMAGHVLEMVTTRSYADLMRQLLLDPLEMHRTEFRLTREQEKNLAWGYLEDPGGTHPTRTPRIHTQIGPAAVLHTTALDMSRFMIANLEGGECGGKRLLKPETLARMHAAQFRSHPSFPGVGYGFFRGPGYVECAGGPFPHASSVLLVPDARVGLFYTSNALSGMALLGRVNQRFLERYFPQALSWSAPRDASDVAQEMRQFEGIYRARFYSRTGPEKIELLFPHCVEVTVRSQGADSLEVSETFLPIRKELTRKGRDLFERADGHGPLAFLRNSRGEVRGFVTQPFLPFFVMPFDFERISWVESRRASWLFLFVFFVTFFWVGVVGPVRALAGRTREGSGSPTGLVRALRLLRSCVALLDLAILAVPVLLVFPRVEIAPRLLFGLPATVQALRGLAAIVVVLDLLLPVAGVVYWRRAGTGLPDRAGFLASCVVAAGFAPFAVYWNLVR